MENFLSCSFSVHTDPSLFGSASKIFQLQFNASIVRSPFFRIDLKWINIMKHTLMLPSIDFNLRIESESLPKPLFLKLIKKERWKCKMDELLQTAWNKFIDLKITRCISVEKLCRHKSSRLEFQIKSSQTTLLGWRKISTEIFNSIFKY